MIWKAAAVGVVTATLFASGAGVAWSQSDDPPPGAPMPGELNIIIDWVKEPKVLPDRPASGSAPAAIPSVYKNCTALNKKYPHGVGKAGARDKTTGEPVTTFKRSSRIYQIAMSHNKRLDRDKDGVACEKK
jgi:hypothetical protein